MQRVQLVPHGISCRNERADAVEFLCIEGQERRLQRAGVPTERAGKAVPKAFAIGLFAVAADHGDRALPDSVKEGFFFISERRDLLGELREIGFGEGLLVDRQQRAVQVE